LLVVNLKKSNLFIQTFVTAFTWQALAKMSKTRGAPESKPCGGSHHHGWISEWTYHENPSQVVNSFFQEVNLWV